MMRNDNKQNEAEWKSQVNKLQQELSQREHDIQLLHDTVNRMKAKVNGEVMLH